MSRSELANKSQEEWIISQYDVSCVEFGKTQSRFKGFQAGCRFADLGNQYTHFVYLYILL